MARELKLPSLGADMEAGTLVEWRVRPGSTVHKGEVIALVETDKGIIDLESFEEGRIERLVVEPGTRVPVGALLALLAPVAPSVPPRTAGRASPAARARAQALGIALEGLHGTGPEGSITLDDVERAAGAAVAAAPAAPSAAPPAGRSAPSAGSAPAAGSRSGLRETIAAAMSRSKREIPHYYVQLTMDFSAPSAWLAAWNARHPPAERLINAVLLVKAVARAACEWPGFNGYFTERGFEPAAQVNIGMAIALRGGGVVAPALLDADRKPLAGLMQELRELVERARSGHLRSGEAASATLTVTNLGDEGIDALLPIIHPPQVAMLGFGSVLERPWAIEGRIEARPVLGMSLAADHRVTDGRQGAQFLAHIREALSKPEEL